MVNEWLVFYALKDFLKGFYDGLEYGGGYPFESNKAEIQAENGEFDETLLKCHGFFEGRPYGKYVNIYPFADNWRKRQVFAKECGGCLQSVLNMADIETFTDNKALFVELRECEKAFFRQLDRRVKGKGRRLKLLESKISELADIIYKYKQ